MEADNDVDPRLVWLYQRAVICQTFPAYTLETANRAITSGEADLVSFGALFLANPDLPNRFAKNAPLNTPDPSTFYGGDAKGYTDYPALA